MNKKLIVCIIVMLLCITATPIMGTGEENNNSDSAMSNKEDTTLHDSDIIAVKNNGDFLDQYQNSSEGTGFKMYNYQWLAQGFIPTLNMLTRVRVYMFRSDMQSWTATVGMSIRESLYGNDLTSVELNSDQLPPNQKEAWIEFDFKDISVIPNHLYYIICSCTASSDLDCYEWSCDYFNPYVNGNSYRSYTQGTFWIDLSTEGWSDPDFCFQTFGYTNNPPNKPITPSGPSRGKPGASYSYSSSAIDPDDDQVYLMFDWGDGTPMEWKGPFSSGVVDTESHIWTSKEIYAVRVKAKDTSNIESVWSDPISITMPYSYNNLTLRFLELLFQRFPDVFGKE